MSVQSNIPFEVTDRGFKHYKPIATHYGHVVRVYESSKAFSPCLWLSVDGSEAITDPKEQVKAHMTLAQAERLRDTLDAAISQHYQQGDGFRDVGKRVGDEFEFSDS